MRPGKDGGLSAPHTAKGRLQRAALEQLHVHVREGTLPTSERFIFYELEHQGVVSKKKLEPKPGCTTVRTSAQNLADALLHLRECGEVPWEWIEDETRAMHATRTAPSIAEFVAESVERAALAPWAGKPAPLIICESRSLAGALRATADDYACPITSTNGQSKGFLVTDVVPWMEIGRRPLYFGDLDLSAGHIEDHTRGVLIEYADDDIADSIAELWERVAITPQQVVEVNAQRAREGLGDATIMKTDMRHRDPVTGRKGVAFPAVETEVLGQARIVEILRTRLDELMPEPLADVRVREERQRAEVAEQLRRLQP